MKRGILIKGGRVVDPSSGFDKTADVAILNGKVEKISEGLDEGKGGVIDARGKIVAPGLVDIHVHFREPGREDEETFLTGSRAAVRGGFTSVACMPNTEPAIDSPRAVKMAKDLAKESGAPANIFLIGAITEGRSGRALADIKGMKREGIVAISDDGASVDDEDLMLRALKEAKACAIPLIAHCEDAGLSAGGVMNSGFMATKMGLRGIPRESEYKRIGRDLGLAKKASSKIHIAHVSCRESVDLIRKAKKSGLGVTAETAPHYFVLTDECCATYDTNTKMNPPLRTKDDVEAIKKGLADGTIDAIASDHAPHTDSEKDVEFDYAPFGIIGLETALALAVTELVSPGILSWRDLIEKMSLNPARILGLGGGGLAKGSVADIVVIDPNAEFVLRRDRIESKSRNSPFIRWKLKGAATYLIRSGEVVLNDGKISA